MEIIFGEGWGVGGRRGVGGRGGGGKWEEVVGNGNEAGVRSEMWKGEDMGSGWECGGS